MSRKWYVSGTPRSSPSVARFTLAVSVDHAYLLCNEREREHKAALRALKAKLKELFCEGELSLNDRKP